MKTKTHKTSIVKIFFLASVFLLNSCNAIPTTVRAGTVTSEITVTALITPTIVATATLAPTPTSTPDYMLWSSQSFSPSGTWVSTVYTTFENGQYFVQFVVEKTDGYLKWEVEKLPRARKPPSNITPKPFHWLKDESALLFTHLGYQDGCFTYSDGGLGLYRLDLSTGEVGVILDDFASEMKLSPDETTLARVEYGDSGVKLLDMNTMTQVELEHLYPYENGRTDQYGLVWSPNSRYLAYTIMLYPCEIERMTSIVIVHVAARSQRILVKEDKRNFETVEWIEDNRILVKDMNGQNLYLNPRTGELTTVSQ